MPKVSEGYSLEQIYKYYKNKVSDPVSKRKFKDIVGLFNKKLSQKILEGAVVKLPHGMSYLSIVKTKGTKHLRFDYGTYNKTGKKLYHLNEHSDGFRARWSWNKTNVISQGASAFSFIPSWTNKRALAKVMKMKDGHKRFKERYKKTVNHAEIMQEKRDHSPSYKEYLDRTH